MATHNQVIDEMRRRWRELVVVWDKERFDDTSGRAAAGADSDAIRREHQHELASIVRAVVDWLDERKAPELALHALGRKKPEIADDLG